MATHLFAAIDVGSFELELGIYEVTSKNELRQVEHLQHIIPLGRDTYNNGKISYRLVDEMCRVLEEFARIMASYKVERYCACATSAMREAKNRAIVLEQIRVRTGIEVTIISNSKQRLFSYKAIAMKEAEFQTIIQKGTAIVDSSFGSLQISMFDKDRLVVTKNMPLGVLRIREIVAKIQADSMTEQSVIEEMVDIELYNFKKVYLKERNIKNLIGIGECILYLAKTMSGGKKRDRISAEEFMDFYERLAQMSLYQIEDAFGVNESYAKLMMPSAIIYKRILEITGAEMLWIPGIHLCDGIAADLAESEQKLKFSHNFEDDILTTSRNMAKRYRCNTTHCQMVERYALDIFDITRKYHGLGNRERLLLQIVTILHDCGKFISLREPADCSYNIIMATEIIGLAHSEREMVANIVRYGQIDFEYDNDNVLVAKLTAILRLADAMDRSHRQKMTDCKVNVKAGNLVITTGYDGDLSWEKLNVEFQADFFEELFGVRPVIKQKRRV